MPRTKQSERRWPPSITKDYYEFCIKQMPKGAIKADLTKHAPHNSYSPPLWYVDEHCRCVECGAEFRFTAKQQQRWFEVLQIPDSCYRESVCSMSPEASQRDCGAEAVYGRDGETSSSSKRGILPEKDKVSSFQAASNKADAPNATVTLLFHSDRHGRGVGDLRRWP